MELESTTIESSLEDFCRRFSYDAPDDQRLTLRALSGDAGFRKYYRLSGAPSQILVDSPPEKENNLAYVRTNLLLKQYGVRVPDLFAVDFEQGRMLLEDLGELHLQQAVEHDRADELYEQALRQLVLIQSCPEKPNNIPEYNDELLLAEMRLFPNWFVTQLLGLTLSPEQEKQLDLFFNRLIASAEAQPKVLVHRDYHSRNLMCLDDGGIAVIDFQDAVWGPITYDLVSLSKDCYLRWSSNRRQAFVSRYADSLLERGIIDAQQRDCFGQWYEWMGLQRHIKVLGIFSRLYLRDEKAGYLNDLPMVLRYVIEALDGVNEFSDILDWILSEVVPACEKQPWYSDWRVAGADTELS